jgi:16S rRNA processing protein RimM
MSDHLSIPPEQAPGNAPHYQEQEPASSLGTEEEWVTIGQIVALFGVRGDLKVLPQTDISNRFAQLREVFLGPDHRRYRIIKASPYKGGMLLLRLAHVESANDAAPLVGLAIMIPLSQIAPLPPDHYYIHDLIGLRVESTSGQTLGVIVDVLATGSNDVYVVRETKTGRDVLVPAVKEMVRRVDIPAGLLVIEPLPGIFDDRFEEVR